ncbi:unnamed protein product [Nippostrongylus brasiliensis]|uniref:C-type lectin domain-containing protein n=1 Tax=Nippostrongylus brasiliensis TaxID=27835 RepID=A0A0N4YEI9_NIPBR|nr:unnamed protein product [Nippostrongylus brasiliensis]
MLVLLAALVAFASASCPLGTVYHQEFNRCYKFVSAAQPFYMAEEACISVGGHVVSVSNGYENAMLSAQPVDGNTCAVENSKDGTWTSVSCNSNFAYVCAISSIQPVPTCPPCPIPAGCPSLPPTVGHCDSGWAYLDKTDSCYRYFLWATFDNAEMVCMSLGGHLTSIHSDEENIFVAATLQHGLISDISKAGVEYKKPADLTWIGLKQTNFPANTTWTWTDGTAVDYLSWAPGQPDDKKDREHCVQTHSDYLGRNPGKDNNYQHWSDVECTLDTRAYVCKKPASH